MAIDLTFSHSLNVKFHPLSREKAKRHLTDLEHAKKSKEGAQCTTVGWGFHPAAFSHGEALGRGPSSYGSSWLRNWHRIYRAGLGTNYYEKPWRALSLYGPVHS